MFHGDFAPNWAECSEETDQIRHSMKLGMTLFTYDVNGSAGDQDF